MASVHGGFICFTTSHDPRHLIGSPGCPPASMRKECLSPGTIATRAPRWLRGGPSFFNNGLDPDTTEGAIDLTYALPNMHVWRRPESRKPTVATVIKSRAWFATSKIGRAKTSRTSAASRIDILRRSMLCAIRPTLISYGVRRRCLSQCFQYSSVYAFLRLAQVFWRSSDANSIRGHHDDAGPFANGPSRRRIAHFQACRGDPVAIRSIDALLGQRRAICSAVVKPASVTLTVPWIVVVAQQSAYCSSMRTAPVHFQSSKCMQQPGKTF